VNKIKPCQCGTTQDPNGNCDGSHLLNIWNQKDSGIVLKNLLQQQE